MKIISKIILGVTLLSGSLIANEVKLVWKGCSAKMTNVMFLLNTIPIVRNNDIQTKIINNTASTTHDNPIIIDRDFYNQNKSSYDLIYIALHKEVLFTEYLMALNFNNESLQIQNKLLDGIITSIFIMDCMEVIE